MHGPQARSIEELAIVAVNAVTPVDALTEPWIEGWYDEAYRHSEDAALPSKTGAVTIGLAGLQEYEECVQRLQREPAVRERWDSKELWSVVAELIVAAADAKDATTFVRRNLERIRNARPSLVVVPIANVIWSSAPMRIAGGVLGLLDDELRAVVGEAANGRADLSSESAMEWVRLQRNLQGETPPWSAPGDVVVVAAWWTNAQTRLAVEIATRRVEDVCCLALLLSARNDEETFGYLRGSSNRPGPRGKMVDRSRLESAFADDDRRASLELVFQPLVISSTFGRHQEFHWGSADPIPLDVILKSAGRDRVGELVLGENPVSRRLRVAARWYADAHWSRDVDDAALMLGVALDALVGSRTALPGRLMAQRFALLDPERSGRHGRVTRYNDIYSVRSAIAHGGVSSRLADDEFIFSMANDVRWTADRLYEFSRSFRTSTEGQLDSSFEALGLGTASWPSG